MPSGRRGTSTAAWQRRVRAELHRSRKHLLALVAGLDDAEGEWFPARAEGACAKWHVGRIAFLERQRLTALLGPAVADMSPDEAPFARGAVRGGAQDLPPWPDILSSLSVVRSLTESLVSACRAEAAVAETCRAIVNDEYGEARFVRQLRREQGLSDAPEPTGRLIAVDTDVDAPPRFHVPAWEPDEPERRRSRSVVSLAGHRRLMADEALALGQRLVGGRDLRGALACFERAGALASSAEALTYQGWMHALLGNVEVAEDLCHAAIEADPDFGNPYNDLGTLCVQRQAFDEAVQWFERAKRAPRYEPRHFPYVNLGKLYASRGEVGKALAEFEGALNLQPADPDVRLAIERLKREVDS